MADLLTDRLRAALELTYQLFGRDARKESPVPVLSHLLAVCAIVQQDGGTEDEAIAGLLHDTLEDKPTEITPAEIERRFGPHVLALVRTATDTPPEYGGGAKAPWPERKRRYLAHIRTVAPEFLRVTVADKVDNLRAILADYERCGESFWERFNAPKQDQVWYYRSAAEAYRAAGFTGPLLDEMERLVRALEAAAGPF